MIVKSTERGKKKKQEGMPEYMENVGIVEGLS
jgi:hypothetical protein